MNLEKEWTSMSNTDRREMLLFALKNQEVDTAYELAQAYVTEEDTNAEAWYLFGVINVYKHQTVDSISVMFDCCQRAFELDSQMVESLIHDLNDVVMNMLASRLQRVVKILADVDIQPTTPYHNDWMERVEALHRQLHRFVIFDKYWEKYHTDDDFENQVNQVILNIDRQMIDNLLSLIEYYRQRSLEEVESIDGKHAFLIFLVLNDFALFSFNDILNLHLKQCDQAWIKTSVQHFHHLYLAMDSHCKSVDEDNHAFVKHFYSERLKFGRIMQYLTRSYWKLHSDEKAALESKVNDLSKRLSSRFTTKKRREQIVDELQKVTDYLEQPLLHQYHLS